MRTQGHTTSLPIPSVVEDAPPAPSTCSKPPHRPPLLPGNPNITQVIVLIIVQIRVLQTSIPTRKRNRPLSIIASKERSDRNAVIRQTIDLDA